MPPSETPTKPLTALTAEKAHAVLQQLPADLEALLEHSLLLRSLEREQRRELLARSRVERWSSGDTILREGEAGECFYLIADGAVEVSTSKPEVGEVSLSTLSRGAFFGEVAVLKGAPRTATVVALTDLVTVAFERTNVEKLVLASPRAKKMLEALVAGRARDALDKIERASLRPGPEEE